LIAGERIEPLNALIDQALMIPCPSGSAPVGGICEPNSDPISR
jgi:hypothetical protein